jgi:hypothetical protein
MEVWIPLLQSLVWPVFVAILFFAFKGSIEELIQTVKQRVETGSEMSLGPGGFTLGNAPKLEPEEPHKEDHLSEELASHKVKDRQIEDELASSQLAESLYLVHGATYDPNWSEKKGRTYYDIRVELRADDPNLLKRVSRVVYYLHRTFPNRVREIKTRENNFELRTKAYGQFKLRAEVHFKSGERPLTLYRYLNF